MRDTQRDCWRITKPNIGTLHARFACDEGVDKNDKSLDNDTAVARSFIVHFKIKSLNKDEIFSRVQKDHFVQ